MSEKENSEERLTVIDFFCGAGGFSEGFRRAGYKIVMGVDNWKPAIETHNLNHGLNDTVKDILTFDDVSEIGKLPNTDIIIGSPPCVLFSLSNHGGNADKELGIRLIKTFYKIIAVKKFQKGSCLKAWLMENVPNSRNYVEEEYTFEALGLKEWAEEQGINPEEVAIRAKNNGEILCSSDYGAGQTRKRFVCGEIVSSGKFPKPDIVCGQQMTLRKLFENFPSPLSQKGTRLDVGDPNYPSEISEFTDIHDHFYDTGVYRVEWEKARNAKLDHPYMGRMSFPENFDKPSRTIMATRSASTREAILYRTEMNGRKGDGEFRTPTIREAAMIMGFPLSYQFVGNDESTKWRQIGNAVCVQLSYALAKKVLAELDYPTLPPISPKKNLSGVHFLDCWQERKFDKPPKRNPSALFRMHPVKAGNMTVDFTNKANGANGGWRVVIHAGTGSGYKAVEMSRPLWESARGILDNESRVFLDVIRKDDSIKHYDDQFLDIKNREYGFASTDAAHPYNIIKKISEYIGDIVKDDYSVDVSGTSLCSIKSQMPISQIMSIYALGVLVV